MLLYDLARLGKIMISTDLRPEEMLQLVADNAQDQARNYLANVVFVEIDFTSGGANSSLSVWPMQQCGDYIDSKGRQVFIPDVNRSLAFPYTLPSGGNPLHAQGRYAAPVYPIYDAHFKEFVKSQKGIESFLQSRIGRTTGLSINDFNIPEMSEKIRNEVIIHDSLISSKSLGLLVIMPVGYSQSPYRYHNSYELDQGFAIGGSALRDGFCICADVNQLMENIWDARFNEGAEAGSLDGGCCSICGRPDRVVSGYNKSLLWIPTTWEAPLPDNDSSKLIDGIALCRSCYINLTLGASVFSSASHTIDKSLVKEIFAPVASSAIRHRERKKPVGDIYGGMIALPLMDVLTDDLDKTQIWIDAMCASMPNSAYKRSPGSRMNRHLDNITGFSSQIPLQDVPGNQQVTPSGWRLSLIYFSGEPSKLNIHLRSIIEDIIPSTAQRLSEIVDEIALEFQAVMQSCTYLSDKSISYRSKLHGSLPYLISTAFGAPYLWITLEKMFKRQPISDSMFVKNFAMRMSSAGRNIHLPETIFNLQKDGVDYLAIRCLLERYHREIVGLEGRNIMKNVTELIAMTWDQPPEQMTFITFDELAFAAGQIVERFGKMYYNHTDRKDYIKHRVMTYGRSLTPEMVINNAVGKIEEYAFRLNMKPGFDLLHRAAVVTMGFAEFENDIKKDPDRFIAAFWAGYSLGRKDKGGKGENFEKDSDGADEKA